MDQYSRTRYLVGQETLDRLWQSRIAVFGVGGVGGNAVETLARIGVGHLDIIDHDDISVSNLNRQIVATRNVVGCLKVDAMKKRILQINPNIEVKTYDLCYLPETRDQFDFSRWDYIVDAIDMVTAKIDLIMHAKELKIPIISALGCGNRLDPSKVTITDLYKTSGDPLAKVMRNELRKRGVDHLKVVYSTELPIKPTLEDGSSPIENKRLVPGSTPFVPSVAGIMLAYEVFRDITKFDAEKKRKEQNEHKTKIESI